MDPLSAAWDEEASAKQVSNPEPQPPVIDSPGRSRPQQIKRTSSTNHQPRSSSNIFARYEPPPDLNSIPGLTEQYNSSMSADETPTAMSTRNGKGKMVEMMEPEAGPSDYWRRSPSPSSQHSPPAAWRQLSTQTPPDDPEDGPSDIWVPKGKMAFHTIPRAGQDEEGDDDYGEFQDDRPPSPSRKINGNGTAHVNGTMMTPPRPTHSEGQIDWANMDTHSIFDELAYEKRIEEVFGGSPKFNRSVEGSPDSRPLGEILAGISPRIRTLRLEDEPPVPQPRKGKQRAIAPSSNGEDESEFPQRDDLSEVTPPSTVSASLIDSQHPSIRPSVTPSPFKRSATPYLHPSVSRLRSHLRTTSSSTQQTVPDRPSGLAQSRLPSHFSQISLARSITESVLSASRPPVSDAPKLPALSPQSPPFSFHPLRQLSAHLFSRQNGASTPTRPTASRKASSILGLANGAPAMEEEKDFGRPLVMDVRGIIAVGTEGGLVLVYGFDQTFKLVLRNDATCSSGPVTAVRISPDNTFIAVGHATGNIHLYDLANPTKPARTTVALTLKQVLSGRKEGHLQGSRILHLGFIGARHTSIVSGDEHGRAFWWSLGKVVGIESVDVLRMLGSYPEREEMTNGPANGQTPGSSPQPPQSEASNSGKKPTTLFAVTPLPMGKPARPVDELQLAALLTPVKLVIVALKPNARTWYRRLRDSTGGVTGGLTGCVIWKPGSSVDTTLAYSWGNVVRFLRVRLKAQNQARTVAIQDEKPDTPIFSEDGSYQSGGPVMALQWYDDRHILIITDNGIELVDVINLKHVETMPFHTHLITSNPFYSGLMTKHAHHQLDALGSSVRVHRGKVFILTETDLQVGSLLHWNDRILARVHQGNFLEAIQVALAYYEDRADGNIINLPAQPEERRNIIGARVKELMKASLEWAFSEDRMRDDTHYSVDGRGVDLTGLFEGLANSCIDACLALDDPAFLFSTVYEYFATAGIQNLLLHLLEPHLLDARIKSVPPNVSKALLVMHDDAGDYEAAESLIWHLDPTSLDIHQAVMLCEAHGLWDALFHVYTKAMGDYIAPLVKLIDIITRILATRWNRPALAGQGDEDLDDAEQDAPDAYKVFAYLEHILCGTSYPLGEILSDRIGTQARAQVFAFVFSAHRVVWPDGPDGSVVSTLDDSARYPYLHLLLQFDTEAFLHSMDIAFEDPFLNESKRISRQSIVNILLDVMTSDRFHSSDITLLHIFVAHNLPKYPQFLFFPPSTLHSILLSLADDADQSTREDRQLAAEYLLSAYTPDDVDVMLEHFEAAGFYRILRMLYLKERKWSSLVTAYVRDPELDIELFANLDDLFTSRSKDKITHDQISGAVSDLLAELLDLSVRQTAHLLDKHFPSLHAQAIQVLSPAEHKQMAYLRCLLDPSVEDEEGIESSSQRRSRAPLDLQLRHLYVSLLTKYESSSVISFLDRQGAAFFDLPRLGAEFESVHFFEGQLWALDRQGKSKQTFKVAGSVLQSKGVDLAQAVADHSEGSLHLAMESLQSVSRMAVRLCQEHSVGKQEGVEDMWYGVLHEIVDLVHSVDVVSSLGPRGKPDDSAILALETLRSLVQETLQALVSSSSAELSFPRLFKRLVDSSTTSTNGIKDGRAYSEFRTILTGMLDSYRSEGEMLSMTTRLVEADLFEGMKLAAKKRQKGWGPHESECVVCGKNLVDEEKQRAVVVIASGKVRHASCGQ